MDINGQIVSVDLDGSCFYKLQIQGENGALQKITLCYCRGNEGIKDYLQLGNKIIKREGVLEVMILGAFGSYQFDYPCCDG